MKKSKKSIQEMILATLAGKKAMRHKELGSHVESYIDEARKVKPKYVINRIIKKMINDDIIEERSTEHSSFLSLTSEGRQKLRNMTLSSEYHLVSTTWDGYWRVIIVDIRDKNKKSQDAIRYLLKKAQFVQIKGSVWISPHPLEHMMISMKKDMGLDEDIMVMVTNKIDAATEQTLITLFGAKEK